MTMPEARYVVVSIKYGHQSVKAYFVDKFEADQYARPMGYQVIRIAELVEG